MNSEFTIYAADSKQAGSDNSARLLPSFNGLSLGEVRSFVSDLIERDIKKGYVQCLYSTPRLSRLTNTINTQASTDFVSASVQDVEPAELTRQAKDALYDQMSQHEILTTVWAFSDKTLIIVKS